VEWLRENLPLVLFATAVIVPCLLWTLTRPCRACGRRWNVFETTGGFKKPDKWWAGFNRYEVRCKHCGETTWRIETGGG